MQLKMNKTFVNTGRNDIIEVEARDVFSILSPLTYQPISEVNMANKSLSHLSCERCQSAFTSSNPKRRFCTKSCASKSRDTPYPRTHGHAMGKDKPASPEYQAYMGAKGRCRNPKDPSYYRYGGRGIEFRFDSFQSFLIEVGERPSSGHSLDRINVNGHYEVGNLRWATRSEQQNNKTNNHYITYNGETLTDCEWSERLGLSRNAVRERLQKAWCDPCAVTLLKRAACPHRSLMRHSRFVEFNNEILTVSQWTQKLGLTRGLIATRLNSGWSVRDALMTPVKVIG